MWRTLWGGPSCVTKCDRGECVKISQKYHDVLYGRPQTCTYVSIEILYKYSKVKLSTCLPLSVYISTIYNPVKVKWEAYRYNSIFGQRSQPYIIIRIIRLRRLHGHNKLRVCVPPSLPICLSVYLSVWLLSVCPSVHPPTGCLPVCLFSVCLSAIVFRG